MSEIKVNSIKGVSASTAALTINNTDGTCTANLSNRQNRNLIINGAMQVAQRGTSSTTSGYNSVDRFQVNYANTDEAPTQAQVDVASGTTPYTLGFRKALKITNGNQTSGAGTSDYIRTIYKIEAQDVANSGWNYTSASSYITLSFWVKASVAQTYYVALRSYDGTSKGYCFSMALSADTWTKVTHSIPGHADLSFDNNVDQGMYIQWFQFWGTNNTGTVTLNQWNNYSASTLTPDQTATWYTTNDATFELTGVQFEVGSVATDFEHRSFGQELALCQRYYQVGSSVGCGYGSANGYARGGYIYAVAMRAAPTLTLTNSGSGSIIASDTSNNGFYVTYGSLGGSSAGIFSYTAASEL